MFCLYLATIDYSISNVIFSYSNISSWKLRKMAWDLLRAKKENSDRCIP